MNIKMMVIGGLGNYFCVYLLIQQHGQKDEKLEILNLSRLHKSKYFLVVLHKRLTDSVKLPI